MPVPGVSRYYVAAAGSRRSRGSAGGPSHHLTRTPLTLPSPLTSSLSLSSPIISTAGTAGVLTTASRQLHRPHCYQPRSQYRYPLAACCLLLAGYHRRTANYGLGSTSFLPPARGSKRMKTRKLSGTYKMDAIRKKFPNHTEIAYREAVSKLKYFLAESYAPKIAIAKPITITKRLCKENIPQTEEYVDDADIQSVMSDTSKKEPSTRSKYYTSRLSHFPMSQVYTSGNERVALPPAELSAFIDRQEEYIEQLERESQYCREELKNLVEKVREVVAENEALQDKNKTGFIKSVLESYPADFSDEPKRDYRDDESRLQRKSTSSKPLEGPSIVFESRISELEAQLTQARLELRKARDENQQNLERLADRRDEPQLQLELERASREKRELEAKTEELQRELAKARVRDADVEVKSKRAKEVAQQAEFERAQAEAEVRRLKDELERRQEKLRDALQDGNRRVIEEKQQVERRFSQQMEQLSADVASHWEAASKSHLESERQRREIADLKRELAQKTAYIDDLKKELQTKTSKMQEELNEAIAERDASQEEVSTVKLTSERNERQARQEQARLQSEINSYKMRLERADADLVHARRENLRLTEEIAALEKEINMNKIVEETRVGAQPPKTEKGKDEKDKDKELASLIYDLESKQAKTVASLEDALNKQASLVSRLTAECQSLTQRLEANDQKHKKEMANLQGNIEYLSNKIRESFDPREQNTGELAQTTPDTEQKIPSELINSNHEEIEKNNTTHEKYNLGLNSQTRHEQFENQLDNERVEENHEGIDSSSYASQSTEEQNLHQNYSEQPENYGDDYANQQYNQYNQYDPTQYPEYFNDQQYNENQEYSQDQQYPQNEQYLEKENYKEEPYSEQDYKNYSNKHEEK